MGEHVDPVPANISEIARQLRNGDPSPRVLVRVLLSWFGNKGRGSSVVQKIRTVLGSAGIRTVPDFSVVYLDAEIGFELVGGLRPGAARESESNGARERQTPGMVDPPQDTLVGTRVGMLPSATGGITSVGPDEPLENAITLMMLNDYSQLPVVRNERAVRGVVSWKSIGEARTRRSGSISFVRDCMHQDYELVRVEQPLLDALPKIIRAEFVLVEDPSRRISGIVTTTDVSEQFSLMAEPYILLGEIESHLRRFITLCATEDEIRAAVDPRDPGRVIETADDLTFGEYRRLLQGPTLWSKLPFELNRRAFDAKLEEIRIIRNNVMHFSPDGIAETDRTSLKSLVHCLQILSSQVSTAVGEHQEPGPVGVGFRSSIAS